MRKTLVFASNVNLGIAGTLVSTRIDVRDNEFLQGFVDADVAGTLEVYGAWPGSAGVAGVPVAKDGDPLNTVGTKLFSQAIVANTPAVFSFDAHNCDEILIRYLNGGTGSTRFRLAAWLTYTR